jgi:hypothetical protein
LLSGVQVNRYKATRRYRNEFQQFALSDYRPGRPRFTNGPKLVFLFNKEMDEDLQKHPEWTDYDAMKAAEIKSLAYQELADREREAEVQGRFDAAQAAASQPASPAADATGPVFKRLPDGRLQRVR